jgi:predicted ThiF/HesA family dinucleotide-utilizing enzyme
MAEIIIKVNKAGETTVSVNGVSGPGCRDLTANIEKALGKVSQTENTAEYYEAADGSGLQAGQL